MPSCSNVLVPCHDSDRPKSSPPLDATRVIEEDQISEIVEEKRKAGETAMDPMDGVSRRPKAASSKHHPSNLAVFAVGRISGLSATRR